MLDAYNPALRKYVSDNHFMDTFAFHTISGHEMPVHPIRVISRLPFAAAHMRQRGLRTSAIRRAPSRAPWD
jgi:hypothetical protein